ncbi:MAG: TrmB family transcriptional regulator [Candidatus Lokiarchaeota archaeon]|nr:TrmB family transcriptional regulator [Candidatus Lokiarchaeota archaeon]
MDMINEKAIASLVKLGFKEYQAKIYCALNTLGQASATEIHKFSKVPRPRVYDTLDELIKFGAINYQKGRPNIYKAVAPVEVVERLRNTYLTASDEAIKELEQLNIQKLEREFEHLWILKGEINIENRILDMLSNSNKEIFVRFSSIDKYEKFYSYLEKLKNKNVKIKSIIFPDEKILLKESKKFARNIEFKKISPTFDDKLGIIQILSNSFVNQPHPNFNKTSILIADMKESIFIFQENKIFEHAIWTAVPIMVMIQRTIFEYLWQNS